MASNDDAMKAAGAEGTYIEDVSEYRNAEKSGLGVAQSDDDDSARSILDVDRRRAAEKRLVRKLDARLISSIILIFIMNYIDVRGASLHL